MAALDELTQELSAQCKEFDTSGIAARINDYFRARSELLRIDVRISQINSRIGQFTADQAANLDLFREELAAASAQVISGNTRLYLDYLSAFFADFHGSTLGGGLGNSTAGTRLAAVITKLTERVIVIVRKYKDRIDPVIDLRNEVDTHALGPLTAFGHTFIPRSMPEIAKNEPDFVPAGAQRLAAEFQGGFDAMYEANAALFVTNDARLRELREEREPYAEESAGIKADILQLVAQMVSGIVAYLQATALTCTRSQIRDVINTRVIGAFKTLPAQGMEGTIPEDASPQLRRAFDTDGKRLGVDIENRLRQVFETYDPLLFNPAPAPVAPPKPDRPKTSQAGDASAHVCGALCLTQDGRCSRRTTGEFCYQHEGEVPGEEEQKLAGAWRLAGVQEHFEHSGWEAELTLRKTGAAAWKQTKGANMWAKRAGRWNLKNGQFVLRYKAPKAGLVEWTAADVKPGARTMSGGYRTPQISKHGAGWGGTWSGGKV